MNLKRKILSGVVLVILCIAASNVSATTEIKKDDGLSGSWFDPTVQVGDPCGSGGVNQCYG
jgi:hypothetical protein